MYIYIFYIAPYNINHHQPKFTRGSFPPQSRFHSFRCFASCTSPPPLYHLSTCRSRPCGRRRKVNPPRWRRVWPLQTTRHEGGTRLQNPDQSALQACTWSALTFSILYYFLHIVLCRAVKAFLKLCGGTSWMNISHETSHAPLLLTIKRVISKEEGFMRLLSASFL